MNNKALFLDRDGVVNVDYGYVCRIDQFKFIDGIFEVAKLAKTKGYKIIIVTNQSGIGRGIFSESDFQKLNLYMKKKFAENEAYLDDIKYSPYHPIYGKGKYRKDDISRKPKPGMILEAMRTHNLDLNKSIFIGDKITDMMAGSAAGVGVNLLFSEGEQSEGKHLKFHRIRNLIDALDYF